ncbi:24557_t:CDS:2, partial [Racocetra persica]
KIESVIYRAQSAFPGRGNEVYLQRFAFVDDDNTLTQEEKDDAKLNLAIFKDRDNLLYKQDKTYRCDDEATKWTSSDEYIDRQILLAQTRAPLPEAIPEWIPYELLTDVHFLSKGGYASVYTATYMRGLYTRWSKTTRTLSRGLTQFKVILKKLDWDQQENDLKNE